MTDHKARDPRRLFTPAQRETIAIDQQWRCAVCNNHLPESFDVHHVIEWANGGRTTTDNGMAVCRECHRTAPTAMPPEFTPRQWQGEALTEILPELVDGKFATLNAAPGAGKTLFTGMVFNELRSRGIVDRLAVFVPNNHLRGQWASELGRVFGVNVQEGTYERPGLDGAVSTYHMLANKDRLGELIAAAESARTLFVFDEVHHLGMKQAARGSNEAMAWASGMTQLVGSPTQPKAPALNLSGTLFRSGSGERISTVTYRTVGDRIESVANYSVRSAKLVTDKQLRPISLYTFDSDFTVHGVDIVKESGGDVTSAIDLGEVNRSVRRDVLKGLFSNERYVSGMVAETMRRISASADALGGHPLKGLIIAHDQETARYVHGIAADMIGARAVRLAVSADGAQADREIAAFRALKAQGILVAVQKVTEGFDVPDIAVLTYMKTWTAPLFVNQMVARAMRVTARERQLETIIPATVLLPADQQIKQSFASVLTGSMDLGSLPKEPCERCGELLCVCMPVPLGDKECRTCQMPFKVCTCVCTRCGKSRYRGCTCPRGNFEDRGSGVAGVDVHTDLELTGINHNGNDVSLGLYQYVGPQMDEAGVPAIYGAAVASGLQQAIEKNPVAFSSEMRSILNGGE